MWNLSDYPDTGQVREYDIEAISLPIVYNQYGDHDPNGLLYVLREDSQRIRKEALRNFRQPIPQPYEGVQPLVIRAIWATPFAFASSTSWAAGRRSMSRGFPTPC